MSRTFNAGEVLPFVDLTEQTAALRDELRRAIDGVLNKCDFILGTSVQLFEDEFARFVGVPHAIGVASGVDALRLALLACEVRPDDEVILPANTFIATALAVSSIGARPVLVDCDPGSYLIDVALVEQAITPKTRVIMPVHLAGQVAEMDTLCILAERHGLELVEDCAQAHGASYRGRPCGSFGRAGCFSFYPGKNLGAFGDGGLVITHEGALAERIRRLGNYGQQAKYHHVEQGLNSRLDTLQAAVLRVKLPYLSEWNRMRQSLAAAYFEQLTGIGDLRFQQRAPGSSHVYHLFIVETDRRDALQRHLAKDGIQTGIHYPIPIHLQTAYAELGYSSGAFPHSEQLARRMLSLPMFPELGRDRLDRVCDSIRMFFH